MGKAFTEEERAEVQENLRRIGLRLFAERGRNLLRVRRIISWTFSSLRVCI